VSAVPHGKAKLKSVKHDSRQPAARVAAIPADARPIASSAALVVFNLIPLWGVLFHGWDAFTLLLLFWFENFIIGGFNVLRMAMASGGGAKGGLAKLVLIPFFVVHYGIFTAVHGALIFALFGAHGLAASPASRVVGVDGQPLTILPNTSGIELTFAFFGLCASHGVSFVTNYIGRGEYRRATARELMVQPYGRVVVLHLTVLLTAFLVAFYRAGSLPIAFLVLLKIGLDLRAHWVERRKLGLLDEGVAPTALEGADAR
jgi:hypothetical protein